MTILSKAALFAVVFCWPLVNGCAAKFACKEKIDGVTCNSITSTYNKEVNGKLSGKSGKKKSGKAPAVVIEEKDAGIVRALQLNNEKPVRIPPKVVRIWIAPWEDSDGDLHQPEFIFSEILDKKSRWVMGEKGNSVATQIMAPTTLRDIPNDKQDNPQEGATRPK